MGFAAFEMLTNAKCGNVRNILFGVPLSTPLRQLQGLSAQGSERMSICLRIAAVTLVLTVGRYLLYFSSFTLKPCDFIGLFIDEIKIK